ncbi:MAG TPA: PH domain-containing protein [Candidatus Saccharimonadales bacterium]|jgi:hypothetical protein|nr:PH domain-containing protein [Candidatus Saccharimonadales bacterium]
MTSQQAVDDQLKKIGADFRFWGRNEIKELSMILAEEEVINQCVNGHYQGGFAMLAATDRRLILVDRKPMFLTIEVIWYDKIGQIDFNHRLLNATLCISTPNKDLNFTSWNSSRLRAILLYSQHKMALARSGNDSNLDRALLRQADREEDNRFVLPVENSNRNDRTRTDLNRWLKPAASTTNRLKLPGLSSSYDLTLYGATRLPFSRRRYYSRSVIL